MKNSSVVEQWGGAEEQDPASAITNSIQAINL
jgi:hypothetical protein